MQDLPLSSRYRIAEYVATGGMGTIYKGYPRRASDGVKPVALKRTHEHLLTDPNARKGILEEARNGSLVRHPNVVAIRDIEHVSGEIILVMDYVDGLSLAQMLGKGRLPIGFALRIVLDACAGLSAIHNATDADGELLRLVHRDVSPQNLLVGTDGIARVADFGIAKSAKDSRFTAPSMRRGKAGYMAPEYIRRSVSHASSDVFALGVVLWEALAGRALFTGASDLEVVRNAEAAVIPSLVDMDDAIAPALERVVRKCLARFPENRYATAMELQSALERASWVVASRTEVARFVTSARYRKQRSVRGIPRLSTSELVEEPASGEQVIGERTTLLGTADVELVNGPQTSGIRPKYTGSRRFPTQEARFSATLTNGESAAERVTVRPAKSRRSAATGR